MVNKMRKISGEKLLRGFKTINMTLPYLLLYWLIITFFILISVIPIFQIVSSHSAGSLIHKDMDEGRIDGETVIIELFSKLSGSISAAAPVSLFVLAGSILVGIFFSGGLLGLIVSDTRKRDIDRKARPVLFFGFAVRHFARMLSVFVLGIALIQVISYFTHQIKLLLSIVLWDAFESEALLYVVGHIFIHVLYFSLLLLTFVFLAVSRIILIDRVERGKGAKRKFTAQILDSLSASYNFISDNFRKVLLFSLPFIILLTLFFALDHFVFYYLALPAGGFAALFWVILSAFPYIYLKYWFYACFSEQILK